MNGSGSRSSLPWATLLLAGVCALATLQAHGISAPGLEAAEASLERATGMLLERPYLEPGVLLAGHVPSDRLSAARREHERRLATRAAAGVPAAVQREQQAALDAEIARVSEALASLPAVRRGLTRGVEDGARPAAFLTYVLLHGSLWHLLGNLLLLGIVGLYLEPALGSGRTALVLLGGTLGAAAGFVAAPATGGAILVGTSALLVGLLAVFAWVLRESRGEGFYAVTLVGGGLWLGLPVAFGADASLDPPGAALLSGAPSPALLGFAAAGGGVGASAAAAAGSLLGGASPGGGGRHAARTRTGDAALDAALEARARGRHEEAFEKLRAIVAGGASAGAPVVDAALALADVARVLGRRKDAAAALLQAVRIEARSRDGGAAVEHWLELTHAGVPRMAEPTLLIRMAALLGAHGRPRAATDALRAALDRAQGVSAAVLAARVARAAEPLDAVLAHDAAWKALGCSELTLEERQSLEALLAGILPRLPGAEVLLSHVWEGDARRPQAIDIDIRTRVLDVVHASPLELDEDGVHIATRGGSKKRVLFERIEAVAVAAVEGLGAKPVLIVDLLLNWTDTRDSRLRGIRLRADRFDPRRLVPGERSAVEALRRFVGIVIDNAQATPLPDRDAALGRPYQTFEEIALYERMVLMADAPRVAGDREDRGDPGDRG